MEKLLIGGSGRHRALWQACQWRRDGGHPAATAGL